MAMEGLLHSGCWTLWRKPCALQTLRERPRSSHMLTLRLRIGKESGHMACLTDTGLSLVCHPPCLFLHWPPRARPQSHCNPSAHPLFYPSLSPSAVGDRKRSRSHQTTQGPGPKTSWPRSRPTPTFKRTWERQIRRPCRLHQIWLLGRDPL